MPVPCQYAGFCLWTHDHFDCLERHPLIFQAAILSKWWLWNSETKDIAGPEAKTSKVVSNRNEALHPTREEMKPVGKRK